MTNTVPKWISQVYKWPKERRPSAPVRYPEPAIQVHDPRCTKYRLANAAVERLATDLRWTKRPVWFGDGRYLLFSDIPNDRIIRWLEETGEVGVFHGPSHYSPVNMSPGTSDGIRCDVDGNLWGAAGIRIQGVQKP